MSHPHSGKKRIVVGVDGSPSSINALRWAISQAKLTGAEVEAVIAWSYPTGYGMAPISDDGAIDFEGDAGKILAEALAEVGGIAPEVVIRSSVLEGHAADALVRAAKGADLLVVGSRGHGGFAGMLLGSVSQHCLQHAGCPVLIFREGPVSGTRGRIVAGIDGSASSHEALGWAVRQAELTGAVVDAVIAWRDPSSYGGYWWLIEDTSYRDLAAKTLGEIVERTIAAHSGVIVRQQVAEGHPARVLLDAAAGADLLVVGSRGHGGFAGMLLGSVSQHCVQDAACPVVVIRSPASPA